MIRLFFSSTIPPGFFLVGMGVIVGIASPFRLWAGSLVLGGFGLLLFPVNGRAGFVVLLIAALFFSAALFLETDRLLELLPLEGTPLEPPKG